MTIKDLLKYSATLFRESEIENPRFEAGVLLSNFLGKDKIFLAVNDDYNLTDEETKIFKSLVKRRAKHEPMAYILGFKEFYGRNFYVDENVLIPRPETEMLVDLLKDKQNATILDLCAGSGCIGLSLSLECTDAKVTLADVSPKAVEIIKKNAECLKISGVKIIESDLFNNIEDRFDTIVCNPPYIKTSVIDTLEISVKDYEPTLALDGGEDGLYFYKKTIPLSKEYLKDNGNIYFEIGYDQGDAVREIFRENNFEEITIHKDLANLDRVISATKKT